MPLVERNPYMMNLQQMLMQLGMHQMGVEQRAKETQASRLFQAQLAGYRPRTPEAVTVQGPGGGRAMPGPMPTPDITIGGKGLYAPQISVETKKLPGGQTAYFLKQGPKTTGFSVTKPEKKGKLFTVQTPEGPKYYEHTGQGQFKETNLPAPPKVGTRKTPTLPQKHQVILRELNEIRARNKLNPLDIFELGSLPAPERKKILRQQTEPVIKQLTGADKTRYLQLTKKLESLTLKAVGGLPTARKITRRGWEGERPVVQYDDGTIEYAD